LFKACGEGLDEFLCVLILLYICPHTTMCPHTTTRVSIGLGKGVRGRVDQFPYICVPIQPYVSSYYSVSSYYYACVCRAGGRPSWQGVDGGLWRISQARKQPCPVLAAARRNRRALRSPRYPLYLLYWPALYSQLLEETGARCDRLGARLTCFTGAKYKY
jgi:hypothetical protein